MGGLAVSSIVLGTLLLLVAVGCAIAVLFSEDNKAKLLAVAGVCGVLVVGLGFSAYFFTARYYENTFYSHYNDYNAARSAVGIFDQKLEDAKPELLELVDELVGLDEKLTRAVETRPEQLKTLIERYPELRANEKVRELIAKYVSLVSDVADQKLVADSFGNAFNKNKGQWPAREFAPDDLPSKLALYNPPFAPNNPPEE